MFYEVTNRNSIVTSVCCCKLEIDNYIRYYWMTIDGDDRWMHVFYYDIRIQTHSTPRITNINLSLLLNGLIYLKCYDPELNQLETGSKG